MGWICRDLRKRALATLAITTLACRRRGSKGHENHDHEQ